MIDFIDESGIECGGVIRQGGKMDDGVKGDEVGEFYVSDVGVKRGDVVGDPSEITTLIQVGIEPHDLESCVGQHLGEDRPDVASMTGNQYAQAYSPQMP